MGIIFLKAVSQTSSLSAGSVCHDIGIPVQEVSPSWSKREFWEEAFVTSSLRFIQHVETVKVPLLWEGIESKTWSDLSWAEKQFQGAGCITTQIQVVSLQPLPPD